jgi:hypothetical protein
MIVGALTCAVSSSIAENRRHNSNTLSGRYAAVSGPENERNKDHPHEMHQPVRYVCCKSLTQRRALEVIGMRKARLTDSGAHNFPKLQFFRIQVAIKHER